jgi:hypothetical protein
MQSSRRTEWARRLVALALAAGLAACAVLLVLRPGAAGARDTGRPTVVVLDVSGSIGTEASRRVRELLASVAAHSPAGAGLVLFSDTGYVALPPTSSPRELLAYSRYFRPPPPTAKGAPPVLAPPTPWESFSGGTSISTGLAAARQALARAGVRRADVVVASDFSDDVMDELYLRRQLHAYSRVPGVALWTMPLPPWSDIGLASFRQHAPGGGPPFRPAAARPGASASAGTGVSATLTAPFLLAACLLLAAIAAQGLVGMPFSWGERG